MGIFDWIPSVDEVIDFIDCRLGGHQWEIFKGKDGKLYKFCHQCHKKEEI